jgi:hypothetical protein
VENDSIRASGTNTLIDIWIEGKLRAICVTSAAIETFLGAAAGSDMTEDARCEFVRTHLPLLVKSVKERLRGAGASADTVVIDAGQLGGVAEVRVSERRKGERRKLKTPPDKLPHGERRRTQRRRTDRRQAPARES